jgi:5-methylcytosine-specific restriction enzyme subunit McrC
MATLFEHGEWTNIDDRKGLEGYLHSLWREYKDLWQDKSYNSGNVNSTNYQPFLSFDGNSAKANNFIGFIHHENTNLEIYPKVFRDLNPVKKDLMHRHLFYWFSYCRKLKFPFNQSFLDNFEIDQFPELIIYLISRQINDAVNHQPYSAYEEVQEALATPRGRINFSRYTNRLSYGAYHIIDCDHEPFVFDNKLNRIIKYCSRLLLTKTRLPETQRILNEIIFLLDEVEDQVCSVQQLNGIRITALFQNYEEVIHSCRMILESQIYSHAEYEMKNWSLLLPMEYVFEDFVAGFLKKHFSKDWKVEYQKSNEYLCSDPDAFQMRHDIFLSSKTNPERKIIIDTKYKFRTGDNEKKHGVAQSDLYQLTSYAYRRGSTEGMLVYPNDSGTIKPSNTFTIRSGFNTKDLINISVFEIPFWSPRDVGEIDVHLKSAFNKILS